MRNGAKILISFVWLRITITRPNIFAMCVRRHNFSLLLRLQLLSRSLQLKFHRRNSTRWTCSTHTQATVIIQLINLLLISFALSYANDNDSLFSRWLTRFMVGSIGCASTTRQFEINSMQITRWDFAPPTMYVLRICLFPWPFSTQLVDRCWPPSANEIIKFQCRMHLLVLIIDQIPFTVNFAC